jgi:hypothetical protein
MPTPQTTVFRPESVSKSGTCKMNLRGSSLYDYANENTVWTPDSTITTRQINQLTSWVYFLPRATLFNLTDVITRDSLLSTATNGFTIMFRFYTETNEEPGSTGTSIIFNGDAPRGFTPPLDPFWSIIFTGTNSSTLQFQFICVASGSGNPQTLIISTENIQINTWYHVAVTVTGGLGKSTVRGYLNGINTATNINFFPLEAPSGTTKIGNGGFGQTQSFVLTDVVFLEKILTNDEILAYSLSAYI